jgi:hypothetical protein
MEAISGEGRRFPTREGSLVFSADGCSAGRAAVRLIRAPSAG